MSVFKFCAVLSFALLTACGNTKLVYVVDDEVRTVADDGSNDSAIGITTFDSGAAWKPGRNGIVYVGEKTTDCAIFKRELYSASSSGSNKSSLTGGRCAGPGNACVIVEPDVNGSGEIVAAHRQGNAPQCDDVPWTLVKISPSGNNINVVPGSTLPVNGRKSANPHWSPDGNSIVFENGGDIFTIPAMGGTTPCAVTSGGGAKRPVWGTTQGVSTIAFIKNGDVHTVEISGSGNCPMFTITPISTSETETIVAWVTSMLAVVRENGTGSTIVLIDPRTGNTITTLATSSDKITDIDW